MENNYFYIDGSGNQQGPVSAHALASFGFNLFGLVPGIIAIVKADKVSSFYRMGQYDQALLASTDAGKWVKYSVIGGILSIVVSIALVVIFFMAIGMSAASFAAVL